MFCKEHLLIQSDIKDGDHMPWWVWVIIFLLIGVFDYLLIYCSSDSRKVRK